MSKHRVPRLPPLVKSTIRSGVLSSHPKRADPIYHLPEHDVWRAAVLRRAGYRCEAIEQGKRCPKAAPEHRLFADHILEVSDGGARYDTANGAAVITPSRRCASAPDAPRNHRRGWGFNSLRTRPQEPHAPHSRIFF